MKTRALAEALSGAGTCVEHESRRCAEWCRAALADFRGVEDDFDASTVLAVSDFCDREGVSFWSASKTLAGNLARVVDYQWWRRKLKKMRRRTQDAAARGAGKVHARGQLYCANSTVNDWGARQRKNRAVMESTYLENQNGDVYSIAELSDKTTALPELRRNEMMTRIAGIGEWAELVGWDCEMWTMTTPSRFHAMNHNKKTGRVWKNPNFDGSTPADAQAWLNKSWQLMRAAFARDGLQFVGLRTVEPHHDGTPHWHLVVMAPPAALDQARDIARKHQFRESPKEAGAAEHRFNAKRLPAGAAAGYAAVYVSKNIDGYGCQGLDDHESGRPLSDSAARVPAWASCWSIRQFQFFGDAPVGLWRTLRRLTEQSTAQAVGIDFVRRLADESKYAEYVHSQRCAALEVVRVQPEGVNRYGEPVAKVVAGVSWLDEFAALVRNEWTDVTLEVKRFGFDFLGVRRNAAARGPVNNCTGAENGGKIFGRWREKPEKRSAGGTG